MKWIFVLPALAWVCGVAHWAHAERADRSKPMNIEADSLTHDDRQRLSVFSGNVVVTKGTIVMRGGKLEVRQDDAGNQYGVLYASGNRRAFFHQKREGLDEYMEGEAQLIQYDGKADTVRLLRQAEIRRLVGSRVADTISGNDVLYNNTTEIVTVDGGARSSGEGATSAVNRGRVRAVLTPQETLGSKAVPSQQLQPSPHLETERP